MPNFEELINPNKNNSERTVYEHRGEETVAAKEYRETAEERERLLAERARLLELLKQHEQPEEPKVVPKDPDDIANLDEEPHDDASHDIRVEETPEDSPDDGAPEPSNPEEAEPDPEALRAARMDRIKKSRTIKKVLITTVSVVSAVIIGLSAFAGNVFGYSENAKPTPEPESQADVLTETTTDVDGAETSEKIGIYDGYGEYGMWLSENKQYPVNFAAASEVAEACDLDEVEMVKYTAGNQVESFADYLANLPEEVQPKAVKGLSIIETERYLESLTDEEFDNMRQQFNDIMDRAFTRRVDLEGSFNNAYMRLKDPNGPVTHDNMELVKCTTSENKKFTEFYWTDSDGNIIGSMVVKMTPVYDEDGNITGYNGCMQAITPDGSKPRIYDDLPEIPTPVPKDEDNLVRIDEEINNDIADDIHTGKIEISQTEDVTTTTPKTAQPTADEYTGTTSTIVENKAAEEAESIGEGTSTSISPENDYSTDLGGANAGNAEENPVVANDEEQQNADDNEIPIDEAPVDGWDLDDILGDLGL